MTPRWSVLAAASLVGGKFEDVSAFVFESRIEVEYAVSRNLGVTGGFNSLNADVTIDKSRQLTDVRYGFESFHLGVDVGF